VFKREKRQVQVLWERERDRREETSASVVALSILSNQNTLRERDRPKEIECVKEM
jgi:hypothetical protein